MFHIVKKNLPKVEAIPWKREFVGSWTSHPPDVSNEHDRAQQALLSSNERDVEDIETRVCTQEASNHDQLAQDLGYGKVMICLGFVKNHLISRMYATSKNLQSDPESNTMHFYENLPFQYCREGHDLILTVRKEIQGLWDRPNPSFWDAACWECSICRKRHNWRRESWTCRKNPRLDNEGGCDDFNICQKCNITKVTPDIML